MLAPINVTYTSVITVQNISFPVIFGKNYVQQNGVNLKGVRRVLKTWTAT